MFHISEILYDEESGKHHHEEKLSFLTFLSVFIKTITSKHKVFSVVLGSFVLLFFAFFFFVVVVVLFCLREH